LITEHFDCVLKNQEERCAAVVEDAANDTKSGVVTLSKHAGTP